MIDFFGDDWKEIRTQIEERNIFLKDIALTKNWFGVSIFYEFPSIIWKNNVLAIFISYQKEKPNSLISELFSHKILKNSLINKIFHTEATSVFLFWGGLFPNRLKTLLWTLRNNEYSLTSLFSCRWSQNNANVWCNTYTNLCLT